MWPNGWMDEAGTWHGVRPQPRRLCVRWGPTPPPQKGGGTPQFSIHVFCGQTAAWIKMSLGTEVGLGPGHIVLDGDPAPHPQRGTASNFWPVCCGQTAGWIKMSLGTEVGLGPGDFVFDGDLAPPQKKRAQPPPIFGSCLLWLNGWMDQMPLITDVNLGQCDVVLHGVAAPSKRGTPPVFGSRLLWPKGWMDEDATWYGGRPRRPRPHCARWGPRKGHSSPTRFGPCLLWPNGRPSQLLLSSCYSAGFALFAVMSYSTATMAAISQQS